MSESDLNDFFNKNCPFILKIYSNPADWRADTNQHTSLVADLHTNFDAHANLNSNANLTNDSKVFSQFSLSTHPEILPVFRSIPSDTIAQSFGLCIYNTDDISSAIHCFKTQSTKQSVPNTHFLYVMGDACRQTDTLESASQTGYPLIIEKGPFLSPDDIKRMVAKLKHNYYALVECGNSFGYACRALDPRSLLAIKEVAPYFGVCLTDLLTPDGEVYTHRAEWSSHEKFLHAFQLASQNFKPNFYVYKAPGAVELPENIHKHVSESSGGAFAGNWDGIISANVKLDRNKLTIIAGPCMLESLELGLEVGSYLKNLCLEFGFQYVFKSSFDKANRTSAGAARGPGLAQGIKWLAHIKEQLDIAVITDVHDVTQAREIAHVADILQIPAFLFRDYQLLMACAQTGKTLQIKKGQWASAQDMLNIAHFLAKNNFHKVILAERGSCFGYNNLVVDFRNLVEMQSQNHAVVFDATHSVQLPGAKSGKSSGLRDMVPALTQAAIAVGIDGLYMEVHPMPEHALSDADTQLSFDMAHKILSAIHTKRLSHSRKP